MEMTQGMILDIIIAVYFLLAFVRGWYVGLALKAAHLAALVAAGILSRIFAGAIGILPLSGVLFLVLFFVFYHLAKVVDIVNWIPVVGMLNRISGAVLGLAAAFLWCCIIFAFLGLVIPQHMWAQWGLTKKVVSDTYLLQVFLQ